jgi:GTP-binding protein
VDPVREAKAILKELRKYDEALYRKPRWLIINKIDLLPEDERKARIAALVKGYGKVDKHFAISAISGEGCKEVTYAVMEYLEAQRAQASEQSHEKSDSAE